MKRGAISLILGGLVSLAVAGDAHAVLCWASDGIGEGREKRSFGIDEAVYLSGELDYVTDHLVCGDADAYIMPAGIALDGPLLGIDVTPGGANYITGCLGAGGFLDAPVWLPNPALIPGRYECVLDQDLDGVFRQGVDYRNGETLFTVSNVRTGVVVDVARIKADAQAQQDHWESVGAAFGAIITINNVLGCATTFGVGPAFAICFYLTEERCVPLSYNDAVLAVGNRIIQRISAAEAHKFSDIVADPPDPNYQRFATVLSDTSLVAAPPYAEALPVMALTDAPGERAMMATASAMVLTVGLLEAVLPTLERIQGAERGGVGAEDNAWVYLQAEHLELLSGLLAALAEQAQESATAWAAQADDEPRSVQIIRDVQEGLAESGWHPDVEAGLRDAGYDDDGLDELAARMLALSPPDDDTSVATAVRDFAAGFVDMAQRARSWQTEAQRLMAANQRFVRRQTPQITLAAPQGLRAGDEVVVEAEVESDIAAEIAWDLDGDGQFDDGQGAQTPWSPPRPGSYLLGVQASSGDVPAVSYMRVDVGSTDHAPPTFSGLQPAQGALVWDAVGGAQARVEVTDTDTPADGISVSWTVDGEPAGEGSSVSLAPGDAVPPATLAARADDGDPLTHDAVAYWAIVASAEGIAPDPDVDPNPDADPDPAPDLDPDGDPVPDPELDRTPGEDPDPVARGAGAGGGGAGGGGGARGNRAGGCLCEAGPGAIEDTPGRWLVTVLRAAPPRR